MEQRENKNEVISAMMNVEYHPAVVEEVVTEKYTKLPLSRVAALGTSFEPLTAAFQYVVSGGQATSGLYKVTVPKGGQLFSRKDGLGYIGGVKAGNGAVGGGQAILNPLVCNPTMLFMAAALSSMDKKLDDIREIQQELLDFLVQKERSELRGDLNFLSDTMNNYKYNWDNEKYKNSNHIKVLDVKQAAERKIDFYREQITSKLGKKSFFHSDQDVKKQLDKIQTEFKDYQLALYLYSFSSFLEVMLLENFNSAYLEGVAGKIEDYSFMHRDLYTKCYEQIEGYSKSSIQSNLLKGLAGASRIAGETTSKVSVFKKKQIDEALLDAGKKIGEFGSTRTDNTMQQFIENQSSYVQPFIDNINTVNQLYNQSMELLFDDENIYIEMSNKD